MSNDDLFNSWRRVFGETYKRKVVCWAFFDQIHKKTDDVNALASKIENEIVRIIGTVYDSKRSSIHINRKTGEVYVDNDSTIREGNLNYPVLSQLISEFKEKTLWLYRFHKKQDEVNLEILDQHVYAKRIKLRSQVAKELNVSKDDAEKLLERYGTAPYVAYSRNDSREINDLQKELKEYQDLYDQYVRLSSSENEDVWWGYQWSGVDNIENTQGSFTAKIINMHSDYCYSAYKGVVAALGQDKANWLCWDISYIYDVSIEGMAKTFKVPYIPLPNGYTPPSESDREH